MRTTPRREPAGFPTPTLSASGALPAGMSFVDNGDGTGTLTGVPQAGGSAVDPLRITAHNGIGQDAVQVLSVTLGQAPTIVSAATATFVVGQSMLFEVAAEAGAAGAITITEQGKLPAGLGFTASTDGTAALGGTAAANTGGAYPIRLTASTTGFASTQQFTLVVAQPPAIQKAPQLSFADGVDASFTITTTGYPLASLSTGSALPAGVSFVDMRNGTAILGGAPDAGSDGSYLVTITATNGIGTAASRSFLLTVTPALTITPNGSRSFAVGAAGSLSLTTDAAGPVTWIEQGKLPRGIALVRAPAGTLIISGTPAANTGGTYPLTITAGSGSSRSTVTLTLTVDRPPTITSAAQTTFAIDRPGAFLITTTGMPAAKLSIVGTLPPWLTLTPGASGIALLTGTPPALSSGVYPILLMAQNDAGAGQQMFTLTVDQAPIFTSPAEVLLSVGSPVSFTIATTATPAAVLSWQGKLPRGVTLINNHNGTLRLTGTPAISSQGTYTLFIAAVSSTAPVALQRFTLQIV